jgi:hypothetical protein
VKALLADAQGRVLSVGEDGFLVLWNLDAQRAAEHFQLSPASISAMALRPGKTEAALIESDGLGLYRLSAWDYKTKRQIFSRTFQEPLSAIGYSGGGTFLIAARSGGILFIDAETGSDLPSAVRIAGTVSFAATGRSERIMIAYLPSGRLSYWELDGGTEIVSLSVPANIASPCLFANNNCLAGFDSQGFLVINAVSGEVILRESGISRGILVPGNPDRGELACIAPEPEGNAFFAFNRQGRLERVPSPLSGLPPGITCGLMVQGRVVLGGADGRVLVAEGRGSFRALEAVNQRRIIDGASSGTILALTLEGRGLGFIPLDYRELRDHAPITVEEGGGFTHVRGDETGGDTAPGRGTARFILWGEGAGPPQLRTLRSPDSSAILPLDLSLREPVLTASIRGDRFLFLDTGGTITLGSAGEGKQEKTLSSPGALDAAFLDGDNIIIGRSTGLGASPFLKVNAESGETVPLAYPAEIGVRVYPGNEGRVYGGIIAMGAGESRTGLIRLDLSGRTPPVLLASFPGEDTDFDIAENGSVLAATLGGRGASIYGPDRTVRLERSPGLPVRLFNGSGCFIVLDREGSIAWHEAATGGRLALLRIYDTAWFLERRDGETLSGKVLKHPPAPRP